MNFTHFLLLFSCTCSIKFMYDHRWSIVNRGFDFIYDFKKLFVKSKHVYNDDFRFMVTELVIRHFDDEESMIPMSSDRFTIDIHLDGMEDLKGYIKDDHPGNFTLVDVHYHFHGHKFIYTCPISTDKIQLYDPNEIGSCFSVLF